MRARFDQVLALNGDIVALQEVRMGELHTLQMSHSCQQNGYELLASHAASWTRSRRGYQIDKAFPGVAFMIKHGVPFKQIEMHEDMNKWVKCGRADAMKVGAGVNEYLIINVHFPNQMAARGEMRQAVLDQLAARQDGMLIDVSLWVT